MPVAPALVLLLAAAPADGPAAPPARPADCEVGGPVSYRCAHALVRAHPKLLAAVRSRLRARLAGDPRDAAAGLALGMIARDRGDPDAERLLRGAAEGMRTRGDPVGEAWAGRALVPLLVRQRRLEEAGDALVEMRRAAEASGNADLRAACKVVEARLAIARAAYASAWAQLTDLEPEVFPDGPAWLRVDTLAARGGALSALGRHREALEAFRRRLELARAMGDRHDEADALLSVASAASRVAHDFSPEVVSLMAQSLATALLSGNAAAEVAARMALAQDIQRPLPGRVEHIERALAVLERTRDVGETCFALRELARWLADPRMGQRARAFDAAEEAIRRARQAGDRFHVARGMLRRWNLESDYGTRERAIPAGLEALDAIEALRDFQGDEELRARVASEWAFVYQQVLGYILTPPSGPPTGDDVDLALRVAERLRAQELLSALDAAGSGAAPYLEKGRRAAPGPETGGSGRPVRPPEPRARQAAVEEIVRAQQSLLDPGLEPGERARLLGRLEGLEVRERALRDRLAAADPAFGDLRRPRLATLSALRQALAPDQALLLFVLVQRQRNRLSFEHPWVLVVTPHEAAAISLPEAAHPDRPVASLAGLVGRRDGSEAAGAVRLHGALLEAALARLAPGVRRLVIVPDAALHRLPFDALRPRPDAPMLGERYEITVVPSASLWLRLREQPRAPRGALLALADPRWNGPEAVALERQAALWQGLSLGQLPRGQVEARRALRALHGGGRIAIGRAATERFLKTTDLRAFGLLHLAAHAVVDEDNPSRSAVVLAPGGAAEDGLLQAREIVGLDLSGLVVVLSACRSSGGEVLPGEGPMSLARAFLQAGARAVVGNLWEVRDDEAELLMSAFYRHLGEGATVGAALAAARRERALAGAPAAAWAGTLVVGDGEATVRLPRRASLFGATLGPAVSLASTSLLALLAFWYGRGRRGVALPGRGVKAPASPAPSGAAAGPTAARP